MISLTFRIQPSRAKEVRQVSANERRMQVIEVLCERRRDTIENLAFEFNVSYPTMVRDIQALSLSHPIYTVQGNGGGVEVMDGYRLGRKYLNDKQSALLERLAKRLTGEDATVMKEILKQFTKSGR